MYDVVQQLWIKNAANIGRLNKWKAISRLVKLANLDALQDTYARQERGSAPKNCTIVWIRK